ncbi:hypothetical protein [Ferrimicrobium acidiphilum]|uniref:hypothetical protein n=1 Tax=Ferrimicrobium acidiphilum TaxID=121039 RepID=UPI0023EFE279|nr:hypothetical protein [Ferrimicrobium acidiphilum]
MDPQQPGQRSGGGSRTTLRLAWRHLWLFVTVAGAGLVLGACGSSGVSVSTPNGSVKVHSSSSGSKVTIKTPKGTESLGSGSSLPSGFPSGIPLPPKIALVGSIESNSSGRSGFELTYSFGGGFQAELNSYALVLRSHGYTRESAASYHGGGLQNWTSPSWNITILGTSGTNGAKNSLIVTVTKAGG